MVKSIKKINKIKKKVNNYKKGNNFLHFTRGTI